jgi:hypothetical protein
VAVHDMNNNIADKISVARPRPFTRTCVNLIRLVFSTDVGVMGK